METENKLITLTFITIILSITIIATVMMFTVKIDQIEDNIDSLYDNSVVIKNDLDTLTANYYNFNEELSVVIPSLLKAHNILAESTVLNDSDVVNSTRMFYAAIREFNDTDKLNAFDDCMQSTENELIINYVLMDASIITFHTREVMGIEFAIYDKDLDYKHTQSIYITRDFYRHEIFDCGSITYITAENKLDVVLDNVAFEEEPVNESDEVMI